MIEGQIASSRPIALVGGGAVRQGDLDRIVAEADLLVAADGGADSALALGHRPDWVIGDLDSLGPAARARLPAERVIEDRNQDTTDFDKCLARLAAPLVLAAGFLGKRVDHQLAAFNTLVRHPAGRVVLIGARDVCLHVPRHLALDLEAGARLSLFPLTPVSGRSTGLTWNIDGLAFAPGGQIGTSNRAEGPVTLEFEGPGMLLILARRRLDAVLAALAAR